VKSVTLPKSPWAARSVYVKARDRASFAFALASAAVALDLDGTTVRDVRVALGGVGTKPWRSREAEDALRGKHATAASFERASVAALAGARTRSGNAFKVELAKRVLVRALERATELPEASR
jgi:xanthine dehydrogenase YagS FAD-binding subunit